MERMCLAVFENRLRASNAFTGAPGGVAAYGCAAMVQVRRLPAAVSSTG